VENMSKEQKFFEALKDIFVGAKVEGESGYINLMRIKSKYFEEGVFPKLQRDIDESLKPFPEFRNELFEKLYTFFNRYFSESGSIYFRYTPIHQNVYEKVYTEDKDVILFWKTNMLYYVKTDILFKNLEVETDGFKFFFDVSTLKHKKAFEKREVVYEFKEIRKDGAFIFNVYYSEKGRQTKIGEILGALKKKRVKITEDILERAFRVFEKQTKVDYFINKNAKDFLREQFSLWLYQYVYSGESEWTEKRIRQLQTLKDIAFKIIDFISQFEEELIKIWNKPKFVLNSNYVIGLRTLKWLVDEDDFSELKNFAVNRMLTNGNYRQDLTDTIKEIYKKPLENIYVDNVKFSDSKIELTYVKKFESLEDAEGFLKSNGRSKDEIFREKSEEGEEYYTKYDRENLVKEINLGKIYIDTKYFPDSFKIKLLNLISERNNLDDVLDGYLIKSDNYHALKSLLPKFREGLQLIYIDPPFNTKESGFIYVDRFLDSSWLSMMRDRLELAKYFLAKDGSIYLHLDHNANYYGRNLMDDIFGKDNFQREIVWNTSEVISGFKTQADNWIRQHDTILFYGISSNPKFKKLWRLYKEDTEAQKNLGWLDLIGEKGDELYVERYVKDSDEEDGITKEFVGNYSVMRIGDVWNDILSMIYTQLMTRENWEFDNQKPENLLRRIIQSSADPRDFVMDFFAGSATTVAAAHKLDRRWIGIEMGAYFEDKMLRRMKSVVFGDLRPFLSRDINWKGGGFFKYYEFEQYEDTLRRVKYEDSTFFENPYEDPYNQYVFMRDTKMLETLEIDYKNGKVKVDLAKLYPNIDVAETLSNLLGKWIKKITPEYVEFEDGEKINTKELDYKLIKPLIWW
jgi:hypothetical protein